MWCAKRVTAAMCASCFPSSRPGAAVTVSLATAMALRTARAAGAAPAAAIAVAEGISSAPLNKYRCNWVQLPLSAEWRLHLLPSSFYIGLVVDIAQTLLPIARACVRMIYYVEHAAEFLSCAQRQRTATRRFRRTTFLPRHIFCTKEIGSAHTQRMPFA
jgi:hypothetical protein